MLTPVQGKKGTEFNTSRNIDSAAKTNWFNLF